MLNSKSSLSPGVHFFAVLFLTIAISASISQSTVFLSSQGSAQGPHIVFVLLLVSMALIGGGVVLGRIAGASLANPDDPAWIPALCFIVYLGISYYSVVTSTAQILDASHATVSHENGDSTRAQNLESQIKANMQRISSYQEQISNADPVRWKSRRDAWSANIERIQSQNMVLMGQRDRVRESSTAKSYADMEETFGLTRTRWAFLVGLLIEMVSFSLSVILGYYSQRNHKRAVSGKKPQGPKLRAVA